MKLILQILILTIFLLTKLNSFAYDPYTVELEQINIPGSPLIQSFAFAQSGGKWLFIGGRINGLHGFNATNSFPKQFSNVNIYVVNPNTNQVWSRNIFTDLTPSVADQFRSTNMQSTQFGNKLYFTGGFGYDTVSNGLITFPILKVIDVNEIINAVMNGTSVAPYVRQVTDSRMQVCGGALKKLGDYFYLAGGHNFTGTYRRLVNNQIYSNQIKKFKIDDDGVNVSISNYSSAVDTTEYHRRDMNLVPAIKPDGITPYMILYGGVFKYNADLPYLNPIYIDENGISVDYSFEQKMSQYTCSNLSVFNSDDHSMSTTFFGGTSLYYYDQNTNSLVYDSLVPFIKDITTLTKYSDGTSQEKVSLLKLPELLGTNAEFILNDSIPHYDNGVIKLLQLNGRTFAGYIFGGIKALMPNNGASYPSEYIFKVYITPDPLLPVELTSFTSAVNKRNVFLKWITASELNNSGFDIERRESNIENQNNWTKINSIRGYGNSNTIQNYFYEDKNLSSGRYKYRLKQIDFNGNFEYFNLASEVIIGVPDKFSLSQNYPNPFNPATKINYELPVAGYVTLKIFDALGKEVETLTDGEQNAGYHSVEFSGNNFSSGIYFYKLETENFSDTKKMFLVK